MQLQKQIPTALVLFKEAIDGFDRIYGLTHPTTIKVLSTFAYFCISQDIFDEAKDIILKALEAAEAEGTANPTTLELQALLDRSYTQLGCSEEGETLLVQARNKVEEVYADDTESAFFNVLVIVEHLIGLSASGGDFETAEQEYHLLISKAEAI